MPGKVTPFLTFTRRSEGRCGDDVPKLERSYDSVGFDPDRAGVVRLRGDEAAE